MQQALDDVEKEPNKAERGIFYFALSDMLMNSRYGGGAWQLQFLTDLSKLPDYEEGYPAYYYGGQTDHAAPVNADGTPVYPHASQELEGSDQRWPALALVLMQASEMSPEDASRSQYEFATFLQGQFDVQTMAEYGFGGRVSAARSRMMTPRRTKAVPSPSAPWAKMKPSPGSPAASNALSCRLNSTSFTSFKPCPTPARESDAEQATDTLGSTFENRQQYDRSAEYWNKSIQKFGDPKSIKNSASSRS